LLIRGDDHIASSAFLGVLEDINMTDADRKKFVRNLVEAAYPSLEKLSTGAVSPEEVPQVYREGMQAIQRVSDEHQHGRTQKSIDNFAAGFTHEAFLERIGHKLYAGLKPDDNKGMYERAYATFRHNQDCPARIDPEPPAPEDIEGDITSEQLTELELCVAIQYGMGFTTLCLAFGKDPKKEARK
jgi:hypothetical protein